MTAGSAGCLILQALFQAVPRLVQLHLQGGHNLVISGDNPNPTRPNLNGYWGGKDDQEEGSEHDEL